jgi:cytochrome c551
MKGTKRYRMQQNLIGFSPFALSFLFCAASFPLLPGCGKNSSPKFTQYYVQGEKLYVEHCSNCHQADGTGLGRVYPPLHISDYMENNFSDVICLIRHGKSGALIVNGQQFNQPMQGLAKLSDLEIAEIATYIYNTWTHERGIVEVKDAEEILKECNPSP